MRHRSRFLILMLFASLTVHANTDKCEEALRVTVVGNSPAIKSIVAIAEKVARSDASVLIHGETGTGKEVIARYIHERSARKDKPFIAINCGAIPENLIESELFGHAKGSFTGASQEYPGLIASAEGGTLFLDEIGDLPIHLQVKLLRVIQERTVRPVGSTRSRPVNIRIISATHRNLEQQVREGKFREDLLYRLAVLPVYIPPLRERIRDIRPLAVHIFKKLAPSKDPLSLITPEAIAVLERHNWPGNIREFENVLERSLVLSDGETVEPQHIQFGLKPLVSPEESEDSFEFPEGVQPWNLDELLNFYAAYLLEKTGSIAKAAKLYGMDRKNLSRNFEQMDLEKVKNLPGAQLVRNSFEGLGKALPKRGQLQKQYAQSILKRVDDNKSQAARILGIDRTSIYRILISEPVEDISSETTDWNEDQTSSLLQLAENFTPWPLDAFANYYVSYIYDKSGSFRDAGAALGVSSDTVERRVQLANNQALHLKSGEEEVRETFKLLGETVVSLSRIEAMYLSAVLAKFGYSGDAAAQALGIKLSQLLLILKKHPDLFEHIPSDSLVTLSEETESIVASVALPLLPAGVKPWTLEDLLNLFVVHVYLELTTYSATGEALGIDPRYVRKLVEDTTIADLTNRADALEIRRTFKISGEDYPRYEAIKDTYINSILQLCDNNKVRAAQILGIDRKSIYRFLERQ